MSLRIGVDTGGTFTDVCVYDDVTNQVHVRKVSSTRRDPGQAIITGVSEMLEELGGREASEISYFAHGTTVGTNALLTGRGVPTAVVTTRGFRDLLELARGRRPKLYDLQADKPETFVPRSMRFEITERVRHTGSIETALDEQEARNVAKAIGKTGVRSVAVCMLYSFLRPEHERRVGEILREELGDEVFITLSSDVFPEFREYERLSTTVVNAYVGPVVADYLSALRRRLIELGLEVIPHVTQSNGGIIPFEAAERFPVRMVLSGPSTGVVGASGIAVAAGFPDIITFDMGGTSSDVSLVQGGQPKLTNGADFEGRPIRSPMLDIHTVGAGGGSIAWIDAGGALKVGPASAGSEPGPACYGTGLDATVTDANVVLGTLNQTHLLDGKLPIDASASRRAVSVLAEGLGLTCEEAAQGIVRVVTANMARAIRVISVQKGYDPRDYTLVPFGGAGPLHASWLARELGITRILVPTIPGALSALGLLMTDVRADFSTTKIQPLAATSLEALRGTYEALQAEALEWLADEQVDEADRRIEYSIELRYVGQNYEIPVAVDPEHLGSGNLAAIRRDFEIEHERLYGYSSPDEAVEAVTYRVRGIGDVPTANMNSHERAAGGKLPQPNSFRELKIAELGSPRRVPVYRRVDLLPGHQIEGPALIEQMDTTTVLLPGDAAEVDEHLNLIVQLPQVLEVSAATQGADTVLVEVISSALSSIVEEMGETLVRAAFSSNIKERRDCTAGLFNAAGDMSAQAEQASPVHLGSLIGVVRAVLDRFAIEDIHPGDSFLSNDPYSGGGSHLPDMVLVSPIFIDGQLHAWAANLAHHADFGDRGHAHIFQEGIRIPPVRLISRGVLNGDLFDMVLTNCQVPNERRADFRAQIAANRLALARYEELAARYGASRLEHLTEVLMDYTERRTRTAIQSIPDGDYAFADLFDCPELVDEELELKVKIRVTGSDIFLDFRGNPEQVRASVNMVWTALYATVYYAIKTLVDPDIPSNAGLHRAIHIEADAGTIVNCTAPAAVNGRTETCQRVVDLVHGALATAVPHRVTAAANGANTGVHFSGNRSDGEGYFVYLETIGGGSGARASKDGLDGVQVHVTNTSNLPVESLETEYPLVVEAYELVQDSGGAGEFRGGMAIRRAVRVEDKDVQFWLDTSRQRSQPWGLFGGEPGTSARIELSPGARPVVKGYTVLQPGDRVAIVTAGAGGYGSPVNRSQESVAADVREEVISPETAKRVYGLDLREEGRAHMPGA